MAVAKALDEVDALLNQGIIEDRVRLDELEQTRSKSRKKI